MSIYSNSPDTPGQLKNETDKIFLKFEKTGVSAGVVSWNIPEPMEGCPSSGSGVYNGIIITLGNSPATPNDSPINEFIYKSDLSVNPDLHSGDKINSQLVVAALYDNKTTTSIQLTDLQANTPYYVQAYPVDSQYRYAQTPARSYSQDIKTQITPDAPAVQLVGLRLTKESEYGINPGDATNLIPGVTYTFEITVNGKVKTIIINGTNSGTYEDLVTAINIELAQIENPYTSSFAPNTGAITVEFIQKQVTSWNGSSEVIKDSIFAPSDPSIITVGSYWYDPETMVLNTWNGLTWVLTSYLTSLTDPTLPGCGKYWFNGTQVYSWSGNAWCETFTFIQTTDPKLVNIPVCGSFWYDTTKSILFAWNLSTLKWEPTSAIFWNANPSNPIIDTFWYDETNLKLFKWNGLIWVEEPMVISSHTEPTVPAPGVFWHDPVSEALKQRNLLNTDWSIVPDISWPTDPTDRSSCDLWWNYVTNKLNVWDVTSNTWNIVSSFQQGPVDPQTCPDIPVNSIWYNSTTKISKIWDGVVWEVIDVLLFPTNPRTPSNGTIWFNSINWSIRSGLTWNPILVLSTLVNPNAIPTGFFWYDTINNLLFQRNGLSWMPVIFSLVNQTPVLGTIWYDTANNTLKRWERVRGVEQWVKTGPIVLASINSNGNLELITRDVGCENYIKIGIETLFTAIFGTISHMIPGADGLTNIPVFKQSDVGTDDTNAARKVLIDEIKMQLGYPVVDVELTPAQLNLAINNALSTLRKRSSLPYRRAFFFFDVIPGQQKYQLTNKCVGYNKIVEVMTLHRMTSAFMSSAHGAGVYGQIILQQLYNFGTFDLLSYELMGQYVNNLEIMFATRLMYNWQENDRSLHISNRFSYPERILIDAVIERTEQDLFFDRFAGTWIQKYALAQSMEMLAQIRGKYSTLPGAGGGISLNSSDLSAHSAEMMQDLLAQIDDFLVDSPGDIGLGGTLIFG